MWLNVIIMGLACLAVGFIVGWVTARPRRWDFVWDTSRQTPTEAQEPLNQATARPIGPGAADTHLVRSEYADIRR